MPEITKETFLKAEDPKNRDAMLFDMLKSIDGKIGKTLGMRDRIEKCEKQMSYVKGIGVALTTIFSAIVAWVIKNTSG
jgi:hypothetical protein